MQRPEVDLTVLIESGLRATHSSPIDWSFMPTPY